MKLSFKLRRACSCVLVVLALHLCLGLARAQRPRAAKGAADSYAQLVAQIGHEASVEGIAFSSDGRLLLTASGDAAVLWEVATGQELRRFLGRLTQLEPFSTDARYVMTAFEQYTGYGDFSSGWFTTQDEHLFDVTTGREINFTAADAKGFWAVVISPDNHLVATADQRTDTVRIWDVATRRQLKQFKPFVKKHEGKGIGFTKDGRFLLTTIEDEQEQLVQLWEPTTAQEVQRFAGKIVRESADSRFLVTQSGQVGHLWERETGREVKRLGPLPGSDKLLSSDAEWQAVFSSDGELVAISPGAQDEARMVRVFESVTGKELRSFVGSAPAFSPDGRSLMTLTGSSPPQMTFRTDAARVWDLSTGAERRRFPAEAAKFSPDNRFVVTLNPQRYEKNQTPARLWELATGAEVLRFEGYPHGVQVARFSPDGRLLATAGSDEQEVRLWDIAARREIRRFAGNFLSGNFEVSRDNRFMMTKTSRVESHAVAGSDEDEYELRSAVQLWDLSAGLELRRFEFRRTGDDLFASEDNEAAFSPESGSVAVNEGEAVSLRDAATGQQLRRFQGRSPLFVPGGSLLTTHDKKQMYLWNVATGQEVRRFPVQAKTDEDYKGERFIAFSPNGRYGITMGGVHGVTVYGETLPRLWDLTTGRLLHSWEDMLYNTAAFSPDSRSVLLGTGLAGDGGGVGLVCHYSVPAGADLGCFAGGKDETSETANYGITALGFSPDGRIILAANTGGTVRLWNAKTGRQVHSFPGNDARISPDGRFVLTSYKNNARLWDAATGKQLHRFEHPSEVGSIDFMSDGRITLTASGDSSLRLWNTSTGQEICRLVSFKNSDWVVIAPDGRFDTNNLDEIKGLHWVTSDSPFTTLPPEIFMRQYYEPRLLPRLIAGEKFAPLPPLADLNRTQPKVEIKEISRPDERGEVSVTVEVARAKSETQRDAKGQPLETGVYDLRLFRDGQLVGYAPREGREVQLDAQTGASLVNFTRIKLPHKKDVRQVEFSAYAFNVAQVKSATDRKVFKLHESLSRQGRAYLITVGINAYENSSFDLSFAVNDAQRLRQVMFERLSKTGEYAAKDIVPIPLTSDYEMRGGKRVVTENTATKRNFQTVLELLSGKQIDPQLLKGIPNAERIEQARPEDLVLISFSSHGYAVPNGDFYFILSDTGPGTEKVATPEVLRHAVSSEELSLWLRDVDAGEMVLVVDACQSTAVVERQGFKPGPMDSRGLGQLSYDKGMRILTATQADNVALESGLAQQGLLTYALVRDGLENGRADFKPQDRQITLSEWLAYGVERVPKLYEEVKQGKLRNSARGTEEAVRLLVQDEDDSAAASAVGSRPAIRQSTSRPPARIQQPSLFDFARKRRDLVLDRK